MEDLRIGQGYEVHKLVPERKLILCGVEVPCENGLLGHSDADVAIHALMDALLGAVSGGDIGAKNGTLSIMVGGSRAAFEALGPIWDILGSNIRHQGGPGMGQHTKMMNQILIAGNMLGVCEALRYGKEVGLDLNVNSVFGLFKEFSKMLSKTPPTCSLFIIDEIVSGCGGA